MSDQITVTSTNHPTWTAFIVYLVVLTMGIGGAFFGGYQMGKVKGALIAIKQNPPNTYNAPVALVDQSTKKSGYMFGLHVGKAWGIGICHD